MSADQAQTRAIDDPVQLARGARIMRAAVARALARRASRGDDGDARA